MGSSGQSARSRGHHTRRLLMTSFGWNDSGGGTTVPRLAAKELARRGWDVTVFHAAVQPTESRQPYEIVEWKDDGVQLVGVHNRSHGLFDLGNPRRELDDPPITAAFSAALDRVRPDVVHFHNLHNLGAALMDQTFARGIPAYFSTHNYWLICPRAYLMTGDGTICPGPGDGSACSTCTAGHDQPGHRLRLEGIRARAQRSLTAILAVSDAVRRTLLAAGYPAELVDIVRQAMPHESRIWDEIGHHRTPGRRREQLTVAFLGSAYPHKGPQLLVEAAQRTEAEIRVEILGEVPDRFARALTALDRRGVVTVRGAFAPEQIGSLLRDVDAAVLPSMWWDCAPLAAAECKAAGIPVIVPRLGGLPEAIRDDLDGLTFTGLDVDDLARTMDRLALDPGLLERLQAAIQAPKLFARYIDELEAYYAGERPGAVTGEAGPAAVRWQGDHGLPTSLSIINDRITERLPGPVQRVASDRTPRDLPLPHAADVEVRHQWPPDLGAPPAGRLAVIQPWEFGEVPTDWVHEINAHVDELWVPSEYVREMYVAGGVPPERVVTVPNGVDLEVFAPDADHAPATGAVTRFLFVGGLIWRKAPDVLLDAWRTAFAGRDDVTLLIKDFGADGIYRGGTRDPILEHARSGALPRVELFDEQLTPAQLADLYRSCDALVHPYRGEGFAMPVLEAMACGLPVIVTGGGPTDEFCPPEAGWTIRSTRAHFDSSHLSPFAVAREPWVLQPDTQHLVALLREAAAAGADERRRRGAAGRRAAERLSWDAVAERYSQRIEALRRRRRVSAAADAPFPLEEDVDLRVLATPAWRGEDQLGELLTEWQAQTTRVTRACLYLLADPHADGSPEELEARVVSAAAAMGVDLDSCADINVLMEPLHDGRDERLHAAMDAYVVLHPACTGHERLARAADNVVVEAGSGTLRTLVKAHLPAGIAS